MKNRWALLVLGLVAALALLAAACGTGSEDDDGTPAALPTPRGDITSSQPPTAVSGAVDTTVEQSVSGIPLDPDAKYGGDFYTSYTIESPYIPWEEAAGIAFPVGHLLNNMLIRPRTWGDKNDYANSAFFELKPDLATGWESSSDGKTIAFTLRDGVKWSDGTPLTCNDVKWSYDTLRMSRGLRRSPRGVHFNAVDTIECQDDLTVVFSLKYAKPAIIEVIGQPYNVIFPAHIYEKEFNDTGDLASMRNFPSKATTGAYTLATHIAAEAYVFERNPNYWDEPLPYLDTVEMQFLSRTNVPVALRAGRLHIGGSSGYTGSQADTLLKECSANVCQFWDRVIASSFSPAMFLNKQREPWNNPAVNEAFALAIDNQKYITTVRDDWYVLPTGCGFYPTGEWVMPKDRCAKIPGFGDVMGTSTPAQDKERAKQILKDAGYWDDSENKSTLELTLAIWQPIQVDAPAFIEDLTAIGIEVEADIQESARAYTNWSDGNFDVGVHSFWIAGIDPDITLYEHFYTGSDRNYNRYSSTEFDTLVDQMSRTVDKEARKRLAWDAMEVALKDVGKVVVSHSSYVPAANAKVRGFMPALNYLAGYGPQYRYDHVWLDEDE